MDMTATDGGRELAGRREWIGLAVLALPTLLVSVDISVLFLAIPKLSADLRPTGTETLWIGDIYGFMIAGFLVTMGTLGDRIGRRKLLMIGAVAFGIASVLAAFSVSAGMLIAARALMGVAGATITPSTLALISNMFRDGKQRGTAIAVYMSCFLGGVALGPIVGGVLLMWFWWGSVFLIAVPVMLLLLVIGPMLIPEHRNAAAGRLDLVSVVLFLAAILPFIYGLKELARSGWQPLPTTALLFGVVVGVVFVQRQRTQDQPLLNLRLFRRGTFAVSVALMLLVGVVQGGSLLLINVYLQSVKGLAPLPAGLVLLPTSLVMICGIVATPIISRRVRPVHTISVGLLVAAVGYVILSQVHVDSGIALLIIGDCVVLLGVGPMTALVPEIVLGSAPPEQAGSAVSVMNTGGELGISLGVATLGTVGTVVYQSRLTDHLPAGVPAGVTDVARNSIADAVAVSARLGGGLRGELLGVARSAFTSGLDTVSVCAAGAFVVFAVLAAVWLRAARSGHQVAPEPVGAASDVEGEPIEVLD
jgi:DHA2 family multidrug resistance protein-like MFS transporter